MLHIHDLLSFHGRMSKLDCNIFPLCTHDYICFIILLFGAQWHASTRGVARVKKNKHVTRHEIPSGRGCPSTLQKDIWMIIRIVRFYFLLPAPTLQPSFTLNIEYAVTSCRVLEFLTLRTLDTVRNGCYSFDGNEEFTKSWNKRKEKEQKDRAWSNRAWLKIVYLNTNQQFTRTKQQSMFTVRHVTSLYRQF